MVKLKIENVYTDNRGISRYRLHVQNTDTDSIVTDIPLDKSLIGPNPGQLKLEYEIKEGYFISAKTYCLVLKDNSLIINLIKSDINKETSLFFHQSC